jgi:ABC-type transport system involved in multi-copper enzyme maturation permease subunit
MELKNIFKMEMYKNRNNKPYLLVIAILTAMAAASTFLGIAMMENKMANDGEIHAILISLIVFTVLGLAVFSLLYPFHLLNADYKNKVISLIFASGVSREKYYFVKISATILTCFIATLVILFIPAVTFLLVYPESFVEAMQQIFKEFSIANITSFMLMAIFSWLAYYVMLITSVIITKGKMAGIFLFIGFSFAISTIRPVFSVPLLLSNIIENQGTNSYFNLNTVFSIIQLVVFVLIGLTVLRRQDL